MTWYKRDCASSRNRKLMLCAKETGLGTKIAFLWDELLSINTEKERDGILKPLDAEPELTSALLTVWDIHPGDVSEAVCAFVKWGLLREIPTGGYEITGWDDYAPPASSTARSKKRRSRPAATDATNAALQGDGGSVACNGADVARNDCNALEQSRKTEEREEKDRAEGVAQVSSGSGVDGCSASDLPQPFRKKTNTVALEAMLHDLGYHPKSKRHRNAMAQRLSDEFCTLDDLALIGKHSQQEKIQDPAAFLATGLDVDWRKRLDEAEKWRAVA